MKFFNSNSLKNNWLAAVFIFGNAFAAVAQDSNVYFRNGLAAFQKNEFQAAADQFETILKTQKQASPQLFFNLGNCYAKLHESGRAVLNYERALALDPSFWAARQNLSLVQKSLADDLGTPDSFFLSLFFEKMRLLFSPDSWAWLAVLLAFLTAGSAAAWLFSQKMAQKQLGFRLAAVAAPLLFLSFLMAKTAAARLENSHAAVVLVEKTAVFVAPDSKSELLTTLHEGSKIELADRIGDWEKIRLPSGEEGWLAVGDVEKI